jgi:hypothetical protein
MTPWKEEAKPRFHFNVMSLQKGKSNWSFSLYSTERTFDAEEIALLVEATDDVSFALRCLKRNSK